MSSDLKNEISARIRELILIYDKSEIDASLCFFLKSSVRLKEPQVDDYDERKRPCTDVYPHLNARKPYKYDCTRSVNDLFHRDSVTVVCRGVIYNKIQHRLQ